MTRLTQWRWLVFGLATLAVAVAGSLWLVNSVERVVEDSAPQAPANVASTPTAMPFAGYSDPYFERMAARLGLQGRGLEIYRQANPVFSDQFAGRIGNQTGEYDNGQIEISSRFRNRFDGEAVATVAHEYLHAVWYQELVLGEFYRRPGVAEQKARLSTALNDFYQRHRVNFDQRLAGYHGGEFTAEEIANELHAFCGTEVLDRLLPAELLAWYQTWLPNRDALPSYFAG